MLQKIYQTIHFIQHIQYAFYMIRRLLAALPNIFVLKYKFKIFLKR